MLQYYHMLEFYQKRSLRTVLHSPLALSIAVLICLGLARIVYDRYAIEQEMLVKRVDAESKLHDLEVRKADLEKKVQYLSNDRGIEAEMRRSPNASLSTKVPINVPKITLVSRKATTGPRGSVLAAARKARKPSTEMAPAKRPMAPCRRA